MGVPLPSGKGISLFVGVLPEVFYLSCKEKWPGIRMEEQPQEDFGAEQSH